MAKRHGLSPPTRGNRRVNGLEQVLERSIPAHAGEPLVCLSCAYGDQVYPRPRGGTSAGGSIMAKRHGLSPPTRGNQRLWRLSLAGWRSIPAHAGGTGVTSSWP